MENILVIGNGFDIAHGLNTKYEDFIKFCSVVADAYANQETFLKQLKEDLNKSFKEKSVSQKAVSYFSKMNKNSDNYKFLIFCRDNYWLTYVRDNRDFIGDKWSDFEFIIAEQIEILSYISNHLNRYSNQEDMLTTKYGTKLIDLFLRVNNKASAHSDFQRGIDDLKKELIEELNQLTWMLEVYLTRFLNTRRKTMGLFEFLPITKLISFNYTDTYLEMYNKQNIQSHYIHGKAIKDRPMRLNNMVFGIGTEVKNVSVDDQYNYVEFQKYYQRITKKTGNDYTKWLNNNEEFIVYFFGHSLDIVDGDIIKNLIYCEKSKVIIFYYNQVAMKALVMNLVKILGKDVLIQFTNEEKITFLKSDDIEGVKQSIYLSQSLPQYYKKGTGKKRKEPVGAL